MTADIHTLTPLDREAFTLLFERQQGLVELTRDRQRRDREFVPVGDAVERIAEFNYFGVAPRLRRRGFKPDVVPEVWSLWLDIDFPEGGDLLRRFGDERLVPTFILHSGRGWWGHWKLAEPVGHHRGEALMRRLVRQAVGTVKADDSWNINRTARLPGSVNEKTGIVARVTGMSGLLYQADDLDRLLPPDPATPIQATSKAKLSTDPARGRIPMPMSPAALQVAPHHLGEFLSWYCQAGLTKTQASQRGVKDRSKVEFAVAKELIRRGLSDDDVAGWFDLHRLPRHTEERARRRDYSWTWGVIDHARVEVEAEPGPRLPIKPLPSFVDRTSDQPAREYHQVDRAGMIRLVAAREPITYTDLWKAIQAKDGCATSAAKSAIKLAREFGYVTTGRAPLRLTPEARRQITWESTPYPRGFRKGRDAIRWALFASKQPGRRSVTAEQRDGESEADATRQEAEPQHIPTNDQTAPEAAVLDRRNAKPRTAEKVGLSPELELRRNWIDHWPRLSFEGQKSIFHIQFLTPVDEVRVALIHDRVYVARDGEPPNYRAFVSRRDPTLDGEAGYDPIWDRTWQNRVGDTLAHPVRPKKSMLAVALLLERDKRGFHLPSTASTTTGQRVPKVGIVLQEVENFLAPLWADVLSDDPDLVTTRVLGIRRRVVRSKKSKRRWHRFDFSDEGPAIDVVIPPPERIDLDLVFNTLADEARIRRYIDPLPAEHCLWGAIRDFP